MDDLAGYSVRLPDGTPLGLVTAVYEMPAGLTIEVQGRSVSSCCRTKRVHPRGRARSAAAGRTAARGSDR